MLVQNRRSHNYCVYAIPYGLVMFVAPPVVQPLTVNRNTWIQVAPPHGIIISPTDANAGSC